MKVKGYVRKQRGVYVNVRGYDRRGEHKPKEIQKRIEVAEKVKRFILKDDISIYRDVDYLFERNRLKGGMLQSFLEDCIKGEVDNFYDVPKTGYRNPLSDFYVDTRVQFNGRRELNKLLDRIKKAIHEKNAEWYALKKWK